MVELKMLECQEVKVMKKGNTCHSCSLFYSNIYFIFVLHFKPSNCQLFFLIYSKREDNLVLRYCSKDVPLEYDCYFVVVSGRKMKDWIFRLLDSSTYVQFYRKDLVS